MKKILNLFISTQATVVLLLIFAFAMGVATFIEERYDTITAQLMVYNSLWFEAVMVLLAINFIGNIKRYNMFRLQKLPNLTFHLAFVMMIVGAGVTRYIGYEGMMHIREGEASNVIYTSKPYLRIYAKENDKEFSKDVPHYFSMAMDNSFEHELKTAEGTVEVKFKEYLKNAVEVIQENSEGGKDLIELTFMMGNSRDVMYLYNGEKTEVMSTLFAFNQASENAFNIETKDGSITFKAPYPVTMKAMQAEQVDSIPADSVIEFKLNHIYQAQDVFFVFSNFYKKAAEKLVAGDEHSQGIDALVVDVSYKGETKECSFRGTSGLPAEYKDVNMKGIDIKLAYGDLPIELPFSIALEDFILDRYAGSMSPSSYESKVILIDKNKNLEEKHRIYMNNVLDYGGYRFFQSSYDKDERGTILSVNHDFWGTWISYIAYTLMTLGFIFVLMSKHSQFYTLAKNIGKIRKERMALKAVVILLIAFGGTVNAQPVAKKPVSEAHAKKFGKLLVQTFDGRFAPVQTMAYDVLHKISRKDNFEFEGKGKIGETQMLLDMMLDAEYWQYQKIIYIREESVQLAIGVTGKYAAFADFFDHQDNYKLQEAIEIAFRKKPAEQNKFDKEVIKVDERLNIFMMVLRGNLLTIFPVEDSHNNKWVAMTDSAAFAPITGALKMINDDLQLRQLNYNNMMQLYLSEVVKATETSDYSRAETIMNYISTIQRQLTPAEILPSDTRIKMETFYNKANIFVFLRNVYALLSVLLLLFTFFETLAAKPGKTLTLILNILAGILMIAFVYHTFGMGLRWYLTDHAPWSNGYEALLLVGWGALLAGFSFVRYSRVTLAATTLLAFLVLMTAGHSSYDPQLTNLQPVLKSYWLIIHVAAITVSYGFLGLCFVLGIFNMVITLFKNRRNYKRLDLLIKELSYISEMNMSVGIVLATIGTFLGGVWANESWGRYWGWDAKETWALIIVIFYAVVVHLRLVPKLKSVFLFNAGAILGFGTILMTFIGVNYYLSKGLHSYASGDTPVFPLWAWIAILSILALIFVAGFVEKSFEKYSETKKE